MESTDDAVRRVRQYFDEMVDEEWHRLTGTPAARVSFEVHRRFLDKYVEPGMRVLEVGAGPGRFTGVLVQRGCRVTVTDISTGQVEANRRRMTEAGHAAAVDEWRVADVRDLSRFEDDGFDAVIAFGGPLSYVFDHATEALIGMRRLVGGHGFVLASVMSLLGAWRHFLPAVLELGDDQNEHILRTGDLRRSQPDGHVCQLYTAQSLRRLIEDAGGNVESLSASNWASLDYPELLTQLEDDPDRWTQFIDAEVRACAEPGALDGGTHLLFACT